MKVYVDLVFIINFFYDYLILVSVSVLLKRYVKWYRLVLSSFIGSVSILCLFFNINNLLFKVILSFIMVYVAFGKKFFLTNIFYFYVISVVLGGSCYLLGDNINVSNIVLLLIISPIIIFIYIISYRQYLYKYEYLYDVVIKVHNKTYNLVGFMDTGNSLVDKISKLPVIMLSSRFKIKAECYKVVPTIVINDITYVRCFTPDYVSINGHEVKCLVGLVSNLEYDCILNNNLRRELC